MMLAPGYLLAAYDSSQDPGLWFVFYYDEEGFAAFDLTREHPDIGYKGFEAVLNFEDIKPEMEKIVLLGGPERSQDALMILHEAKAATKDSTRLTDNLALMSYSYVLQPGQTPRLTNAANQPSTLRLKSPSHFLISIGYRIFDTPGMTQKLKNREWIALPADQNILFNTPRRDRRARFLSYIN